MTKPRLAAVPETVPEKPKTRRINLNGALKGHWVELRLEMTGRELIGVLRGGEDVAGALAAVGSRVVAHSFGGDILDQPAATVATILRTFTQVVEDDAVDPTPASDSDED